MGNNLSTANVFHRNSSSSGRNFLRTKSSKHEKNNEDEKGKAQQLEQQQKETNRQNPSQNGKTGLLKKCKSEKARGVFGSCDFLPLLDDSGSVDSSLMSSGNNRRNGKPNCDMSGPPPIPNPSNEQTRLMAKPPGHFRSSASTNSRMMHRKAMAAENSANKRRVKSFRHFARPGTVNNNRLIDHICPVTGLSLLQKRLILSLWRQLGDDQGGLSDIRAAIYQQIQSQTQLASVILNSADSNNSRIFRLHVERFCQVFYFSLKGLEDDEYLSFLEQLPLEFGAIDAVNLLINDDDVNFSSINLLPEHSYWELLFKSLCKVGQREDKRIASYEAWRAFCIFLVSKIRFGFETERFLRSCFKRRMHLLEEEHAIERE